MRLPCGSSSRAVSLTRLATTARLCLALVVTSPAPALTQSRFDSWTTDNGLPQNSIRDILQTRDGYLWLATEGGLVRFDGTRFVVFDKSVPGFRKPRIGALREDRDGTLWAGTTDGMLIRYRAGRFTTYGRKDGMPLAGATPPVVARIEEDDAGDLWVTWVNAVTQVAGTRFRNLVPSDFALPPLRQSQYLDHWWRQQGATLRVFAAGRIEQFHPAGCRHRDGRQRRGQRRARHRVDQNRRGWSAERVRWRS